MNYKIIWDTLTQNIKKKQYLSTTQMQERKKYSLSRYLKKYLYEYQYQIIIFT